MPTDPLPAWNEGPAKQAILRFVEDVVREGSSRYVAPRERIAVFDNDGTLWCEKPVYAQAAFIAARVEALARERPDLRERQPFKAALDGDLEALAAGGERAILELLAATHAGMTTDEFDATAGGWLKSARHPRFDRPYTELVYAPMLELLEFLRSRGFKNYVVSGGGVEFMRLWTRRTFGLPPAQVIGSSGKLELDVRNGKPRLRRLPEVEFVDDGPGKAIAIHRFIGQRPIFAFGNSDGDLQMLQYVDAGSKPRLLLLLHHDDEAREYAYDRQSAVGRLDRALDEAGGRRWTVVSFKNDFRAVFGAYGRGDADRRGG